MMISKEEIENLHWNDDEESIIFNYGGQRHHYDLTNIKKMILHTWNIQENFEQLEKENKALKKGQNSLMQSRKKWKDKYYKHRKKAKELIKAKGWLVAETISQYIEQVESREQKLIEKLEEKIRYFEENEEFIASNNYNYSDGTVIARFLKEFKEILSIVKGE